MKATLALLIVVASAGCATYSKPKSAVNAFGGIRSVENSDFDDVDDPVVYGAELLIGLTNQGLGIEGGYARAEKEESGFDLETDELYVGLRNTWNTDSTVQPYVGAGATWMDANASESGGFDDDDSSAAAYARAGVGFQFQQFQIGVDARAMIGSDFEIDDEDTDLDYFQLLAFIGFSW